MWKSLTAAGLMWGVVGGLIAQSEKREAYWREVLNDVADRAGNPRMKWVHVVPLKGCGWSFGETVYAETTIGGAPADITMCQSRHGVRFDITIYESRWIRGGAA